ELHRRRARASGRFRDAPQGGRRGEIPVREIPGVWSGDAGLLWARPGRRSGGRMKCPFCGAEDTQVIDSRVSEEGEPVRRRRRCQVCNSGFTTYETAELRMPQIVKNDGVREDFSSPKLRTGFQRALHKRPVTTELVDAAITRIEQKLLALGEREV